MNKALNKIRYVMFSIFAIHLIAITCGSFVVDKEISADQSAAMSADVIVHDASWPAGAINNIVRLNYFAMEPVKVLVLSFPDYDDPEARRIDRFPAATLQADSAKATPD